MCALATLSAIVVPPALVLSIGVANPKQAHVDTDKCVFAKMPAAGAEQRYFWTQNTHL